MDGIGRSIAKVRLEAPAEVKRIRIADFFAHNVDAQLLYGEQLLCRQHPLLGDVLHDGNTGLLFEYGADIVWRVAKRFGDIRQIQRWIGIAALDQPADASGEFPLGGDGGAIKMTAQILYAPILNIRKTAAVFQKKLRSVGQAALHQLIRLAGSQTADAEKLRDQKLQILNRRVLAQRLKAAAQRLLRGCRIVLLKIGREQTVKLKGIRLASGMGRSAAAITFAP